MNGLRVGAVDATTAAALDDHLPAGDGRLDHAVTVVEADPDLLVAVGETALAALADDPPATPILPVDVPGLPVTSATLDAALAAHAREPWPSVETPTLAVTLEGRTYRAALDAMLVTSEPARISEFAVVRDGRSIETVRADGMVVSTPLGSGGYAQSVGGPRLGLDAGVVAVVPVGPFAIDTPPWVGPPDGLTLRVERDETPVECHIDGEAVGPVPVDTPVTVAPATPLRVLRPAPDWKASK